MFSMKVLTRKDSVEPKPTNLEASMRRKRIVMIMTVKMKNFTESGSWSLCSPIPMRRMGAQTRGWACRLLVLVDRKPQKF